VATGRGRPVALAVVGGIAGEAAFVVRPTALLPFPGEQGSPPDSPAVINETTGETLKG
jgi:hypothetical protein